MKAGKITTNDISQMLKGEHSSQQQQIFKGLASKQELKKIKEQTKIRKVGETWEELDSETGEVNYIWTQHEGYRTKSKPGDADRSHPSWDKYVYPNCVEGCETNKKKAFTRLDEKYRKIYGMCTDCAARYETRLKMSGQWEAFEKAKMLANAKSFFNEADAAVKEVADRLEKVEYHNETGRVEKWEGDPERAKQMLEEYNMYKTLILETLEGKRNDVVI